MKSQARGCPALAGELEELDRSGFQGSVSFEFSGKPGNYQMRVEQVARGWPRIRAVLDRLRNVD